MCFFPKHNDGGVFEKMLKVTLSKTLGLRKVSQNFSHPYSFKEREEGKKNFKAQEVIQGRPYSAAAVVISRTYVKTNKRP